MSPEQARGEKLDARTDLFSFGAVLFEMATGHQAFPGETSAIVFDAILNREPVPVSLLNRQIPQKLEEIIHKALEKDPKLRYRTPPTCEPTSCASSAIPIQDARHVQSGRRRCGWYTACWRFERPP